MGPFAHLRVVELTDETADVCGRILADFGADVTKVEPPGGSPARRHPPLAQQGPAAGLSLLWWSYNLGKRSILLDLDQDEGRGLFRDLVHHADILVESTPPGYLAALGLDYGTLSRVNPRLIMITVSPYGRGGPKEGYRANDLVAMAAGGLMYCTGDEDRPPVVIGTPQAYPQAGAQAAVAAVFAYRYRQLTGRGQHIDLSMQEAVVNTLNNVQQQWERHQRKIRRGNRIRAGHLLLRDVYPCKDGHVAWRLFLGPRADRLRPLLRWMQEEGLGLELQDVPFERLTFAEVTQETIDAWDAQFTAFFRRHTKAELFERAVQEGIMLYPVGSPADLLSEPHLQERDAFRDIVDPLLGTVRVPRTALRAGDLEIGPRGPAPQPGDATAAILAELGRGEELERLKEQGVVA